MRLLILIALAALILQSCSNTGYKAEMLRQIFSCSDYDIDAIGADASRMKYVGKPEVIKFPEIIIKDLEPVQFDSIYEEVRIVPLETNENSFFGGAASMIIESDTVYILDARGIKGLLRFTIDGKFIDKIGRVGQGPGEYVSTQNFYVHGDRISIIDLAQQKILTYSKKGDFLFEKRMPFYAEQAIQLNSSEIAFRCSPESNLHIPALDQCCMWVADTNFNIIKSGLITPLPSNCVVYDDNAMKKAGGEVVCFEGICDTLFVLNKDYDLECKYVLDFGKHRDKSYYCDNKTYHESFSNPGFYNFVCCNMNADFVDCNLTIGGMSCICLYSRNSHRIMVYNDVIFSDGVRAPMMDMNYTLYDDYYVEARYVDNLPQKPATKSAWQQHIKGDFAGLKPDDNPVLIFYKLRKW